MIEKKKEILIQERLVKSHFCRNSRITDLPKHKSYA